MKTALLASFVLHLCAAALALSLAAATPPATVAVPVGAHAPTQLADSAAWHAPATLARAVDAIVRGEHVNAAGLLNHLWQSTLFAAAIALLTLAFRRNRAGVRYALWLIASAKFLVPLSLLIGLGSMLSLPAATHPRAVAPTISQALLQVGQPFPDAVPTPLATPTSADWPVALLRGVWVCGMVFVIALRWRAWARIRRAVAASRAVVVPEVQLPPGVSLREAAGTIEPGVVGIWRAIILLPDGIADHLTARQLAAVLAHELCHIRRRDNLTAAVHMLVEAVFWFHPMTWWIGARLVDERERACDEDVLRQRVEPRTYAEGIVNVCKRYVDTGLACVPGVSGSNLKARIEAIMRNHTGEMLSARKKAALTAAALASLVLPVLLGTVAVPRVEAASQTALPATLSVADMIHFAYDIGDAHLSGAPDWLHSERVDVAAAVNRQTPASELRAALRRVLAERFKLLTHTETRELPIHALLRNGEGRLGPQLRRSTADCTGVKPSRDRGVGPAGATGAPACGYFGFAPGTDLPAGRGGLAFRGLTMAELAAKLVPVVRTPVSDQTTLTGYFDGDFDFVAELPPPPPPPDKAGPHPFAAPFASIFAVLPEQLGLTLDARRGVVQMVVIDRIERPAAR